MTTGLLDDVLGFLDGLSAQDLKYEVKKLRAIREWALDQVGFRLGDRVEVVSLDVATLHGWRTYYEALTAGPATVRTVDYNEFYGYWYCNIMLDREWSTSSSPGMGPWWHGRADETPEGMLPPSKYEQYNYPDGRKHTFAMPTTNLRKLPE